MASERYEDLEFMSDVRAAVLSGPRLSANILLIFIVAFFGGAAVWASFAELDEVTAGQGRVIPSSQLQVVQNLEGGILRSIGVKEGDLVEAGQVLLTIDDTLVSSKYREDRSKVFSLQAGIIRLRAETQGEEPVFPEELALERPSLVATELSLYNARQGELNASVQALRDLMSQRRQERVEAESRISQLTSSQALAREEYQILRPLVEQGVSARIELLRLERQINDITGDLSAAQTSIPRIQSSLNEASQRIEERRANFRSQVATELGQAQSELAVYTEVLTGAQDRVRRTEIRSPVNGEVQQVLINTVGGVIQPG